MKDERKTKAELIEELDGLRRRISELENTEEALQESEVRFRSIFESGMVGTLFWDTNGNITDANDAFLEMVGYTRDDVLSGAVRWRDITPPEYKHLDNGALEEIAATGAMTPIEKEYIRKDGSRIPILLGAASLPDPSLSGVAFVVDITDKKKAEEERERLLHEMGERIKELSCIYGVAESIRKRGTLEEIFMDVVALIPPGWHYPEITRAKVQFEGREYVSDPFEESEWKLSSDILVGGEKCGAAEVYYLEECPVLDEGPFLNEERDLIDGITRTLGEAIERKRAEEELRKHRDRLEKVSKATESVLNDILLGEEDEAETERRILDACLAATDSPYGMVGKINEEGNYDTTTYAGKAMEDCAFPEALAWDLSTGMPIRGIWGWPMLYGEALICNDLETHPDRIGLPEGHAPLTCFLGAPLKRDGKVVGMVAVANKPGGYSEEDKYALVKLASVISVSRRHREALDEVSKTSTDLERLVIELREAQEQLIRREKLAVLGQLAGGVGHELRNPLGAIKNAAYFLNMAIEEPEPEVKETLEILEKEVATSERIISSLLGFARPKPPTLRKVNVNDIVQVALSRAAVPENVEVVDQLGKALPVVLADPDQLSPVFDNLILNAVQAMPEGGKLTITSESPEPEWVTISVTDTGIGIPEEDLEKLFEPLFTTKAKGIGLGLSVTKALVDGHGGTIEVKSKEGEGSTFTVRLPIGGGEEK